jgi:hypothetical protein
MTCHKCDEPIVGEWFDGSEIICEHCDAVGAATWFTNDSWAHVPYDDDEEIA